MVDSDKHTSSLPHSYNYCGSSFIVHTPGAYTTIMFIVVVFIYVS